MKMDMKSKVICCTVLLAIVFATTSADPFEFKNFEKKNQKQLLELLESLIYGNNTVYPELRVIYEERKGVLARLTVKNQKLNLVHSLIKDLIKMSVFEREAMTQTTKMLHEIENLQASTMNKKLEKHQLDEVESSIEDLGDIELIKHLSNEYKTLLRQLESLHLEISDWRCKIAKMHANLNVLMSSIFNKFLPMMEKYHEKIVAKLNHKMLEGFETCDMGDKPDVVADYDDEKEGPREAVRLRQVPSMMEEQEDEIPILHNEL